MSHLKECGQVDVTVCHRHLLLHVLRHAAKHVITVLHILVSHTTCVCYSIIYYQHQVSADQHKNIPPAYNKLFNKTASVCSCTLNSRMAQHCRNSASAQPLKSSLQNNDYCSNIVKFRTIEMG